MSRRFVLALRGYLVPSFITGFVWHLVAFHDAYARLAIYRAEPIIPPGFGSMAVQGLIFAWACPRLFGTARDAWAGSAWRAGLPYGALSWSFTTLAVAAKRPMTSVPQDLAIESGFTALQFLLAAPLMALVWPDGRSG
jgi:hypothetical protein